MQKNHRRGHKPGWTLRVDVSSTLSLPVARLVDPTTKAIVAWTGEQQTMRESKPKASAPSTPTATRASAPFFTPTPARASAPNPRHSAAAVSGGAGHNTSGSSMRDQILSVMRQQPAGVSMTAIEIAKSLGG